MSKCKYPKKVMKNSIDIVEDFKKECCYKIVIPICDKGENILVICRKPRPLGEEPCNKLTSRVTKFILNKFDNVESITCVYLFSSYDLDKSTKSELLEKKNKEVLIDEINKASIIIAAWGEPYKELVELFNSQITDIYEFIRDAVLDSKNKKMVLRVGELSKKGYPKHYLAWKNNDDIIPLI
ncbi:MAG: DUF1643 domain-containing protein [Clostridium sp.]